MLFDRIEWCVKKMQAKIHELEKFRDQRHLFEDRAEAGKTLALMLQTEYGHTDDGMILAIPSGGGAGGSEDERDTGPAA